MQHGVSILIFHHHVDVLLVQQQLDSFDMSSGTGHQQCGLAAWIGGIVVGVVTKQNSGNVSVATEKID
jgi:hypothetical protein